MEELEEHLLVKTAGWYYTSVTYRNLSARGCSLYYYLLEGVLTGIWSISLSYIQDNLNLSDSNLGVAVLFSGLGTAFTAPLTGLLLQQFGVQKVAMCAGVAYSGFLCLLGISKTMITLSVTMFVYGLAWGMVDISANSSAVQTEIVAQKTLLGSFHGSYSLAAATGSLIGALMTTNGVGILTMFLIFFAICGTLSVVFSSALYTFDQENAITKFNNHMMALSKQQAASQQGSRQRATSADIASDQRTQEAVNEILQGYDASQLKDDTAASGEPETPVFGMEDKHHITYTTDWKTDNNLWRHTDTEDGVDPALLTPLVGGQAPHRPYNPATDRSRLLSSDIDNYEVRDSVLNSTSSIDEPLHPYLLRYLCCLGFLAAVGETSLVTWLVIYFDRVLGAESLDKSAGFICFMVAMALGRFCCDYLRRHVGRKKMIFVGGLLAVAGLMAVFAVSTLPTEAAVALSSIALMVTGLGLSTMLPICFSSAGHLTDVLHSGTSVATVAVSMYIGGIVGSPLVGVLSDLTGSLRYGLLFIAILLAGLVPLSAFIPEESPTITKGLFEPV